MISRCWRARYASVPTSWPALRQVEAAFPSSLTAAPGQPLIKKSPHETIRRGSQFMHHVPTASRRRFIVLAAAAWLVGLVGPTDAQGLTEATFIVVNNLFSTPAFVAVENGYWAQQGLNVKLKLTSSGRQVTQS